MFVDEGWNGQPFVSLQEVESGLNAMPFWLRFVHLLLYLCLSLLIGRW